MACGAVVAYIGGLVEVSAHTVSGEITDDGEAVGLHVLLDGVADVGDTAAFPGKFHALPEALFGDADQLQGLLAHLTTGVGARTVAVKAADVGAYVNADDVAVLQHTGTGDAVDDLFVD